MKFDVHLIFFLRPLQIVAYFAEVGTDSEANRAPVPLNSGRLTKRLLAIRTPLNDLGAGPLHVPLPKIRSFAACSEVGVR